jgi:hypothetical protein
LKSPPERRYVHDYREKIGKMCEWYHRTLAGGTLALDAPLMLYVIRRFLRQVESRVVGSDVCALRDVMVELVADYEWRTSMKSSEEMLV